MDINTYYRYEKMLNKPNLIKLQVHHNQTTLILRATRNITCHSSTSLYYIWYIAFHLQPVELKKVVWENEEAISPTWHTIPGKKAVTPKKLILRKSDFMFPLELIF